MSQLVLKTYQNQALEALSRFLQAAGSSSTAFAFQQATGYAYLAEPFGDATPCVCLRIPTGGGKTLLAAHAVGRMQRDWPSVGQRPLALWLVPSDTIRSQTLAALATPGHPFREALQQGCGEEVRVCALDELAQLSPQDYASNAVVVVATIQSFRVEEADQRSVYASSEAWESHFRSVSEAALQTLHALPDALVTAADAAKPGREMLARFVGQPRRSLANWLALHRPYVIVDEAHNAKTERSFEALQRLNPALILELTATPLARRSNVLFHVSAQQLQAEQMIKMPITLVEHPQGWQQAVLGAVMRQRTLEAEALQDEAAGAEHVRPIVLLQAQNSTEPVNVDVLREHLVGTLGIPAEQVKVATGTQRELDGLDLSARSCQVRFIITVQALREGWDCPFAYVLCSVQNVRSATAIEQLLGRVLRMPYARRRGREPLNRAYAHVTEAETGQAANALADRLIDGMGFDPMDMASMIVPQSPQAELDLPDDGPLFRTTPAVPALSLDLPASQGLPEVVAQAVAAGEAHVSTDGQRQRVTLRGAVPEALATALVQAVPKRQREQVQQQLVRHNALVTAAQAPVSRGEVFPPVPRLAYRDPVQGELRLLEREAVLEDVELNLLAEPVRLDGFVLNAEQGVQWQLYLDGQRTRVRSGSDLQLTLDAAGSPISAEDLARWLARELQHPTRNRAGDVLRTQLRAFTQAAVNHLLHEQHLPLAQLVLNQHVLVQRLALRIAELREAAGQRTFGQRVLDGGWVLETGPAYEFRFEPHGYPVPGNKRYTGRFQFPKHFYPVLSDLEDGSEEWLCALAIEQHPRVRRWVRNLDSDSTHGFWLPTSSTRFYPDFVCELTDGRLAVIEYKGEQIRYVPKELHKAQVGLRWAECSGGRALFVMVYKLERGLNVSQQLDTALA